MTWIEATHLYRSFSLDIERTKLNSPQVLRAKQKVDKMDDGAPMGTDPGPAAKLASSIGPMGPQLY